MIKVLFSVSCICAGAVGRRQGGAAANPLQHLTLHAGGGGRQLDHCQGTSVELPASPGSKNCQPRHVKGTASFVR